MVCPKYGCQWIATKRLMGNRRLSRRNGAAMDRMDEKVPAKADAAEGQEVRRMPWHKPALRRFDAYSAQTSITSGNLDGGGGLRRAS